MAHEPSSPARTRGARGASKPRDPDVDPDQTPHTLDECRRCALWRDATQPVPGIGSTHAAIMLVGEQPGDREDREGKPFVGPAGALLDAALHDAGIRRSDVYVTNAVKHFKWTLRGKRRLHRTPAQREIEACAYWFERELSKVRATVIVALGVTALRAVLDQPAARLQDYFGHVGDARGRRLVATWHPSYVLRAPDPDARERARADLVAALRRAAKLAGGE
ncbi:DNA polymerase [Paraburkholderia caballeronis]|uniref:Type-4 uracil-DNA glycosylase n=1 Tax=Paraburkholderia caballeronis TaxID=416943 RepID=A0A1H7J5I3_9BURK|nr:DNA polymerase [Paraburkholderia caballeronis]PXX03051.1 DNA polymerase [Paraburkholderia caballeronis]RAK03776.1 DNA polymerase [Paraburkholderia caballeronis]SEC20131.1 DNA polymerase [Paraburkholderia caballeronis]SEK69240.1 DNA polymerase [Paraburkholderia caballeronis]